MRTPPSCFEGGLKIELPACPGCESPTRSWSFCSQLRGWPLSRGTKRSCRGRGIGKGKGRGCEEARWASMHAAPRTNLLLSQALQALPLGHPHRVSEDGKWVASLIEGSTRASAHSCQSPHAANGQSAHQPAQQQQQQQQQPTVGGSQIHKQIPDRACPNWS